MTNATKKVCFISTGKGCSSNLMENALYSREVENQGIICTTNPEEADCLILNSCGYSAQSEEFTLQTLRQYQSQYPQKEIIVGGCLPKINSLSLKQVHQGKSFSAGDVGTLFTHLGLEKVKAPTPLQAIALSTQDFSRLPWHYRLFTLVRRSFFAFENFFSIKFQPLHNILSTATVSSETMNLPLARGCLGTCTYCAIKKARGQVQSTPLNEVLRMLNDSLQKNHRDFYLNADDLGCWGQDIGSNIAELLRAILAIDQKFKLVLSYLSPEWLIKYEAELLPLLKDQRIIAVYIPIHSGSNSILKRMGRHYTIEKILETCRQIKKNNAQLAVKTNYILSFPNENIGDFFKSCLTVWNFDFIVYNTFSPRPGTPAFDFSNRKSKPYQVFSAAFFEICIFIRHLFIALTSLRPRKER